MAFETLKYNLIDKKDHFDWPQWLPVTEHDIVDVLRCYRRELEEISGKVDLVAGGPPCQGFSFAGRRNEQDERNRLTDSYIEFIDLVRPRALFLENVAGFTVGFKNGNLGGEAYSDRVSKELQDLGYRTTDDIIDFSNFGVPQKRKRYILVGMLSGCPEKFFERIGEAKGSFLKSKGLEEKTTLGEAISDLERKHGEVDSVSRVFKEGVYGKPESDYQEYMRKDINENFPDSHRFANHSKEIRERYEYILNNCHRGLSIGKETRDKYNLRKKTIVPLDKDSPCPTLTTLPDDYIHYSEPRILTVREYARVQSFNDWYELKSKYTTGGTQRKWEVPRYTQVGNAVPPLFAELSGLVLKAMI